MALQFFQMSMRWQLETSNLQDAPLTSSIEHRMIFPEDVASYRFTFTTPQYDPSLPESTIGLADSLAEPDESDHWDDRTGSAPHHTLRSSSVPLLKGSSAKPYDQNSGGILGRDSKRPQTTKRPTGRKRGGSSAEAYNQNSGGVLGKDSERPQTTKRPTGRKRSTGSSVSGKRSAKRAKWSKADLLCRVFDCNHRSRTPYECFKHRTHIFQVDGPALVARKCGRDTRRSRGICNTTPSAEMLQVKRIPGELASSNS